VKQLQNKMIVKVVLATMLLALINVPFLDTSMASAKTKPCLTMGRAVAIASISVDTCAVFYHTGSAIHVEKDSTSARYGLVFVTRTQPPQSSTLINRSGESVSVPINLVPKSILSGKTLSQYLFRAGLRKGKVVSLKPFLYVPLSTMVKPFRDTQFIGTVNNLSPSDGVGPGAWMRWNFSTLNSQKQLSGQFVNLNSAIRIGPILEPPAPCQPPLNNGEVPTEWYSRVLGTSEKLSLYWDPAMHMPMDSELVVVMGSGVSYMTSTPSINALMKSKLDTRRKFSFNIHGNPVGTPYQFTGTFSAQTPVRACSLN
jgi:hypothetical protein